MMKYKGVNM